MLNSFFFLNSPTVYYEFSTTQIQPTLPIIGYFNLILDKESIVKYIVSLQNEDGSFMGDQWGEVDTRFSFCAVATLSLLNRLDAINIDSAVNFVKSCMNFDGGFGTRPSSESHAGQIYCCLGFLSIVHRLDIIDADLLGWWLAERQLLQSGGLNGRPEKLPDVCYRYGFQS